MLTANSAGGGSATGLLIKEECEGEAEREKKIFKLEIISRPRKTN